MQSFKESEFDRNSGTIVEDRIPAIGIKPRRSSLLNALRYLLSRAIMIGLTIFVGVFITVVILNQPSQGTFGPNPPQLEAKLQSQIEQTIRVYQTENPDFFLLPIEEQAKTISELRSSLYEESGLNLSYFPRTLYWTFKALSLDWGNLRAVGIPRMGLYMHTSRMIDLNTIILEYLPFTLLLAGSAYFLVFLIGLPLALASARNYGKWFDRLLGFLAPISSIPSWVIGLILISLFAVELKILPIGGIFDTIPPENFTGYIPIVLKHMILPVLSIVLSVFFQLVYTWRTYFVINSEEDYVDLGRAMGLSSKKLEKKYILKPSITYVITSFTLMLASFWQMTMALEAVFNWPGIGWLYIVA